MGRARNGAIGKPHPKNKFREEEDAKLIELIETYGEDWKKVSSLMPGRNNRQCKERYLNYLSPNANNTPFTIEEDLLLLSKYEDFGPHWVMLTRFFKGRSDTALKSRYWLLQRRGITKQMITNYLSRGYQTVPKNNNAQPTFKNEPPPSNELCEHLQEIIEMPGIFDGELDALWNVPFSI